MCKTFAGLLSTVAAVMLTVPVFAAGNGDTASKAYPYGESGMFGSFVQESFRVAGAKSPQTAAHSFFAYMGDAIPAKMDAAKPKLAKIKDSKQRAAAEIALCADLHKSIKKQIPKFSLDRGFEFSNTVKLGERQCYLQSIVIAGLLQRAGVPAGVAMVWRNEKGKTSNNGHAVPIVRLSDGNDILVDASDPKPFMTHSGLMVSLASLHGYAFVEPIYDASHRITGYRNRRDGDKKIAPTGVATLDIPFMRSQFDYYRGERTPGGLFTPPLGTSDGLAKSAFWLQRSVADCPRNPLAVYMLGKVQEKRKKFVEAKNQYEKAYTLYSQYGWMPAEEARSLAAAKSRQTTTATRKVRNQ